MRTAHNPPNMWHPKNMFDRLRGRNASHDEGSQHPSTQPTLRPSSDQDYQLPRLEFERFPRDNDHPFVEYPRSSSDSSNPHTANENALHSIDLGRREGDFFKLESGNGGRESQKTQPADDRNLLPSMSNKEEDPNLVNYHSRILSSCRMR